MGNVTLVDCNEHPIDLISIHAGTSTARSFIGNQHKRIENCFKNGHMSVFEVVGAQFYISDISRACSHQLVRHRIGVSFCQMSQRYTKIDYFGKDWFIVPEEIAKAKDPSILDVFYKSMKIAADGYNLALTNGIKPEDARYMLPEATKTNISVYINLRELYTFLELRESKAAQWEIRELASQMKENLKAYNEDWLYLMELYENRKGGHDE